MHAILSSLFVWNLLRRGKLLSTLWPEIVLFFFIYFSPPIGAVDRGNFGAVSRKPLPRWKLQRPVFYGASGKDDLRACRSMTWL